ASGITRIISNILEAHRIVTPAWVLMPNHAHFVVATFVDQPRAHVLQLIKGGSSHKFMERFPVIREELGGHLWQESYDWVEIKSHHQLTVAIDYVRSNPQKYGLPL